MGKHFFVSTSSLFSLWNVVDGHRETLRSKPPKKRLANKPHLRNLLWLVTAARLFSAEAETRRRLGRDFFFPPL